MHTNSALQLVLRCTLEYKRLLTLACLDSSGAMLDQSGNVPLISLDQGSRKRVLCVPEG